MISPRTKIRITHSISLVHQGGSCSRSTREKNRPRERERQRKRPKRPRESAGARERGRVGFHENSCRSFEASSSIRASHLAESESPGRPCNDAQVHAGQDSPFASLVLRLLSLSLSTFLLPPPPSATVIIIGAALGRAESTFSFVAVGLPWTPLSTASAPLSAPWSRRQLQTSPPRTPSSFPPSSFLHLLRRLFLLPRGTHGSPTFALLTQVERRYTHTHTYPRRYTNTSGS